MCHPELPVQPIPAHPATPEIHRRCPQTMELVRASLAVQRFRPEVGRAVPESLRLQERWLRLQPKRARYRRVATIGPGRIQRGFVGRKRLYRSICREPSSVPTCTQGHLLPLSDVRADTRLVSQADRRTYKGYPPANPDIAPHHAEQLGDPAVY